MTAEIETCEWTDDENAPNETACGKLFSFEDDGPIENGFKFCPFCGRHLKIRPAASPLSQMMTPQFTAAHRIVYSDGRPGHLGVCATILEVSELGMLVQFDDRADDTWIAFSERAWMDFIQQYALLNPQAQ